MSTESVVAFMDRGSTSPRQVEMTPRCHRRYRNIMFGGRDIPCRNTVEVAAFHWLRLFFPLHKMSSNAR